jgi:Zn ribbon nucleic-acid-binding protein
MGEVIGLSRENLDLAQCVECGKWFHQDRDIQLCDRCQNKFNLDKLWREHDANKVDALDFNENRSFREKYRLKKLKKVI